METSVDQAEKLLFSSQVNFDLKNYIDRAILQTIIDSKQENDGPLRIIEKSLFKGTEVEKAVDRLEIIESILVPLIFKQNHN